MSSIPLRWGGMHFDCGGLIFNYSSNIIKFGVDYSVFVVAKFDVYALKGTPVASRQALVWPGGDNQLLWQDPMGELKITVYDIGDSTWKVVGYDISQVYNEIIVYYGYFNGSVEGIKLFDEWGNEIASVSRSDILQPQSGATSRLCIGSDAFNNYKLCGTVFAAAVFDKVIPDDKLTNLTKNWNCEDCYRDIDGCTFACIFDRIKYGDTPYDFINDVYGQPVDPDHPPRWRLKLIKDLE